MAESITIGCGSASNHDDVGRAAALAESGTVDYIGCDCLSERSLPLGQVRKMRDPSTGQDLRVSEFVEKLAPFMQRGKTVVGNFGAANVDAGASEAAATMRKVGLTDVTIGVIRGDDVLDLVRDLNPPLPEFGRSIADLGDQIFSANAYIGAEPIVELLQKGCQFILGGRIADPSLFVGPIVHELGWRLDDWDRVGLATVAGHLLECGIHSTGGNFADPPYRVVEGLERMGFPIAEVSDGELIFTKQPGTGGLVDIQTAKTQLGYEIHDPGAYLTPDVTADLRRVTVEQVGKDRVKVSNVGGSERPTHLKVCVGIFLGHRMVAEISFGGPGCVSRAQLAEEVFRKRIAPFVDEIDELRCNLVGLNSLFDRPLTTDREPDEVRLRVAARCNSEALAARISHEVEQLYFGPAGAAGFTSAINPQIGVTPTLVPRDSVPLSVEVLHP